MIQGARYIDLVEEYFSFLITEFDFKRVNQEINGNVFYDVEYLDGKKRVSISYENIDDHLVIIISLLSDGRLPDYDDTTRTIHLNRLNRVLLLKIDKTEIKSNTAYFNKFTANDKFEKRLLKRAKELRMCLIHFDKLSVS